MPTRLKALARFDSAAPIWQATRRSSPAVIAHAAGVPIELVGRLRGQAPVKPLSIASHEENQ